MTEILTQLERLFPWRPETALILGSGLGAFADELQDAVAIPTRELEGYPQSTVPGHAGRIVLGKVKHAKVLCFQGRVHLYEGYTPREITLPIRIAHHFGCQTLIVTNAAGGINPHLEPGDLMLIEDHINLQFRNPLRDRDLKAEQRFIDMSEPYDRGLMELAMEVALAQGIVLKRGVLGAILGPSYETPAEVRMLARLGADAACMSTVPEVILAKALGLRVLGISCITNPAAGASPTPLRHNEVQAVAARVSQRFRSLLMAILERL
jgi:purine-nucleoside phosphorylase